MVIFACIIVCMGSSLGWDLDMARVSLPDVAVLQAVATPPYVWVGSWHVQGASQFQSNWN